MSWWNDIFKKKVKYKPHTLIGVEKDYPQKYFTGTDSDSLEKEMAEYIILQNGWELKGVGQNEIKVIGTNTSGVKYIVTKQPTDEINKWIVDNYEPNGTLKTKEI